MNTHEQDDIRQYNMPYLIADVIGFLIAIGVAFDEKNLWMGIATAIAGAPLGAILFRTSVVCYRLLNTIAGRLFKAGCLMWIIGVAISLIVPAGVIGVILSAMKGASIGTNAFLILLEIISLCCIYTDVARVYTGRMVKLSPAIQKIVIIVCAILALVSCVFCIFANLT